MILPTATNVLLAIDIGSVFFAVFLIVMFLGWVMQVVQNQNDDGGNRGGVRRQQPQRRQPRPRDERVSSEIDAFLQEVGGSRRPVDDDEVPVVEVVREPPRRRPTPPRRPQPTPPRRPQRRPALDEPIEVEVVEEHGAHLGDGLRAHVESYMSSNIEEGVDANLGDRDAEMPADVAGIQHDVHPLVDRLRSPDGVRQAILLSEILDRPRPFRRS